MDLGKKIRLSRIFNQKTGNTIIIPMDHHGVTLGPIKGIEDPEKLIKKIVDGGANAVLSHIGTITHGYGKAGIGSNTGVILHMNAATGLSKNPIRKVWVNNIQTAIKMGVDAVSFHVNLGNEYENEMINELGFLANECLNWGMPLIAMMYVRGEGLDETDVELVRHSARIASELGCDVVKVPYTGSIESMKKVVEGTQIPVIIAGGSKMNDKETLKMVEDAMKAGCAGVSMGRNVFERKDPKSFIKALSKIIHG